MVNKDLDRFILRLSTEMVDDSIVTNMYFGNNKDNEVRLSNLRKYLEYFLVNKPQLILIGEAPGYKGCCVSGIPFTSTGVIGKSDFFKQVAITEAEYLQGEATASIVWNYLDSKGVYPLFWNAFPFHPHKKDNTETNVKPTKAQLALGKTYICDLVKLFPDAQLVAVGKVAQSLLEAEGITAKCVRHPSFGGKADFIRDLDIL